MLVQDFYESKQKLQAFIELMRRGTRITKPNTNIRLPDGLHIAVKKAATGRCTLEEAYAEALNDWLLKVNESDHVSDSGTSPDIAAWRSAFTRVEESLETSLQLLRKQVERIDSSGEVQSMPDAAEPGHTPAQVEALLEARE